MLHSGTARRLRQVLSALAARRGPNVAAEQTAGGADVPVERLVIERSLTINTAAAGGNASLMTID